MKDVEAKSKVKWKDKPFSFKGFTLVTADDYNSAELDGYKMIVIAYIKWRDNSQFPYKISYQEWTEVLQVSDKTARTVIEGCRGIIHKESGTYYQDERGMFKQEANTYSLKENTTIINEEKVDEYKKESILDREHKLVTDVRVFSDYKIFKQIFDKKTFIRFEGYKIWKETTCPHVKQAGQKKIDSMRASKNTNSVEAVERLEREYQEFLQRRDTDRGINEINDYEEFKSSFKIKEKEDLSYLDEV